MNSEFEFTSEQLSAISSNNNMIIIACPGSGKTAIIVEKIRNEISILEKFKGVIGITFTVKASKELRKRCKESSFDTKSSFFGTIEHFCLSEIIYPFINRVFGNNNNDIECIRYEDLDDSYKQLLPDLSKAGVLFNSSQYEEYETEFKRYYNNNFILLEAISVIANKILTSSESCRRYLRSRYSSIYIDEYQDSSEPQHKLFLNIVSLGLKGVAVGDVNQSIYEWRGGSSEFIQQLIAENEFELYEININHRSHPSIINYSSRLLNKSCTLLPTDDIKMFQLQLYGTQSEVAQQINQYIRNAVSNFNIKLLDIAILVRNNSSLEYLMNGLDIPYRAYIDDPLSSINSTCTKLYQELLKYKFDSDFLINDVSEFEVRANDLSLSVRSSIIKKIKRLRFASDDELELALEDISLMLLGKIGKVTETDALKYILGNEHALKQYMPRKDEVQIMTLHKSKGLEFEVVFHLDLYEWVFPYREYTGNFDESVYPDWSQELNLHYVGITRAKKACVLIYSTRRINSRGENKQGAPSIFLNMPGLNGLFHS